MDEVARLAPRDRSDLFRAAAEARGVTVPIIEKDFWICWILRQLFMLDDLPAELTFKGGTSLSKVFGIIDRMSEDIDLVIDRAGLGFAGEGDPATEGLGTKERERRIEALKRAAAEFIERTLADRLRRRISDILTPSDAWSLRSDVSNLDNPLVLFAYPSVEAPSRYLQPSVRLELGARGDTWPSIEGTVTPYAAEIFPASFGDATIRVRALAAERTFWEKATILHAIAHQEAAKARRMKPARHYYDVHRLWRHETGRRAASDRTLLAEVVRHKSTFFPDRKARYDLAVPGSLRLVPPEAVAAAIRAEYATMSAEMVFGEAPSFEEVLEGLGEIEAAVNGSVGRVSR